jgi:hypothetical protein
MGTSRLLLEIELVGVVLGEEERLAIDDLAAFADGIPNLARLEGHARLDVGLSSQLQGSEINSLPSLKRPPDFFQKGRALFLA